MSAVVSRSELCNGAQLAGGSHAPKGGEKYAYLICFPQYATPPDEGRMRSRGLKGREEASEWSIVSGNGCQGGITDVGKLSGLPGNITTDAV
jgi:hypothetical protein